VIQKLTEAISIVVLIAQPLITLNIGLKTGELQLGSLLRNVPLVARFFLATFVVMPALATVSGILGLPRELWVGLGLMSIAPPAPPATRKLRESGNASLGLEWQALAFLLSVVTLPLTVALLQHLGLVSSELNLTWGPVLLRSVLFFGAPVIVGFVVRRYWPSIADALVKPVGLAANVALIVLTLLVLPLALPIIWRAGFTLIAVTTAFVIVAIAVGHLFGGPERETRITLATLLAARFPVPALILAQANGATKVILPVVLIYVVAGSLLTPVYDRVAARSHSLAPPRTLS
jgi:bile acid:Na+ symporter, BASS family